MIDMVDCPACQGRGVYRLQVELLILDMPCDLCSGKRKVPFVAVIEYNGWDASHRYSVAGHPEPAACRGN